MTILACISCNKRTTLLEAQARKFNTGRCGWCGGSLNPARRLSLCTGRGHMNVAPINSRGYWPLRFVTPYAARAVWRFWVLPQDIDPAQWTRDYAAAARGPQLYVNAVGAWLSPFARGCQCAGCRVHQW